MISQEQINQIANIAFRGILVTAAVVYWAITLFAWRRAFTMQRQIQTATGAPLTTVNLINLIVATILLIFTVVLSLT